MTFENLDSNFDKVATGEYNKNKKSQQQPKPQEKKEEDKYEAKFEKNKYDGLLTIFQQKLEATRKSGETNEDEFETINVTSQDISSTQPSPEKVSSEEIDDLLNRPPPPAVTTEQDIKQENKNPITDAVGKSEDIVVINSEVKQRENTKSDPTDMYKSLKVVPKRYDEDHQIIDKKAHLSDGFSQQAISRAARGESPNGLPQNDKEVDGDYIAEQLRLHRENKQKQKTQGANTDSTTKITETIVSDNVDEYNPPTETIITDENSDA